MWYIFLEIRSFKVFIKRFLHQWRIQRHRKIWSFFPFWNLLSFTKDECESVDYKLKMIRFLLVLEMFIFFSFSLLLHFDLLSHSGLKIFSILSAFLFFESTCHLREDPLTGLLVQLAWLSGTYFSRYRSSKIALKFSLAPNFIPRTSFFIFDIFILGVIS